jgi:hypothetical protein
LNNESEECSERIFSALEPDTSEMSSSRAKKPKKEASIGEYGHQRSQSASELSGSLHEVEKRWKHMRQLKA